MKHMFFMFICLFIILPDGLALANDTNKWDVKSPSAILVNADSGEVLYEKDPHKKVPTASLTKLMTLMFVHDAIQQHQLNLDDKVTISEKAAAVEGAKMQFVPGQQRTIKELIEGTIIASANDAAFALSEAVNPDQKAFIKAMNEKAKELKMNDTMFYTVNGLKSNEGEDYSTSSDMAKLASEYIHTCPDFLIFHQTKTMMIGDKKKTNHLPLLNGNGYEGVTGLKNGWDGVNFNTVASAKRDRVHLIAVVMGATTSKMRAKDTIHLLDYGFSQYTDHTVIKDDQVLGNIPAYKAKEDDVKVSAKHSVSLKLSNKEVTQLKIKKELPKEIIGTKSKGSTVGEAQLILNGKVIDQVPLVTTNTLHQGSLFKRAIDSIKLMFL